MSEDPALWNYTPRPTAADLGIVPLCCDVWPDEGYECTLMPGHGEPHIAHGTHGDVLKVWTDAQKEAWKREFWADQ